jgi:hypothetical protein
MSGCCPSRDPAELVSEGITALDEFLDAHEAIAAMASDGVRLVATHSELPSVADQLGLVGEAADARCGALVSQMVSIVLARCKAVVMDSHSGGRDVAEPEVRTFASVQRSKQLAPASLTECDRLVWLLNSFESFRAALMTRSALSREAQQSINAASAVETGVGAVVEPILQRLTGELNGLLDELARAAAHDALQSCGLSAKLAALQTAEAQSDLAMAEIVGLEPLALSSVMRSFYGVLFRRGDALLPHAERIASPALRRFAHPRRRAHARPCGT